MNWRQIVARSISEVSAFGRRSLPSRKGLRVLLYHAVGTPIKEDKRKLFTISSELFETHMMELSQYKENKIVELNDTLNMEQGSGIAITFDDGYRDNLTVATPILEKYRIPFAVFITTSYVQSHLQPYLIEEDVRMLSEKPYVSIGSHGVSHISLTQCNKRELKNELESSKHYLEDLTGKEITMISYPHGCINKRVLDAASEAGYRIGASSCFNINRLTQDKLMLCRTNILCSDTLRIFRQKIHGDWDWYKWWQQLNEIVTRKCKIL
jgi:peptidoglycan/xylan/chitin deacetylase (PgdA/CDA1 family)